MRSSRLRNRKLNAKYLETQKVPNILSVLLFICDVNYGNECASGMLSPVAITPALLPENTYSVLLGPWH